MKRYIALFTATLLLVANCIVYTPVKAVGTSVDFAEMFSEYLSLAEMSMALTQGVEIDWSNFEFDANATNQEKAKALMNYYYGLIYNGLDYFLDLSGNQDVISEQMAAIALQTSGNLSSENIQDLRSQVSSALQNYAVTGNWNVPIMQHYNDVCIAYWNKYNSLFINDYLDNLNVDSDVPTPSPPISSSNNVDVFKLSNVTWSSTVGQEYYITISSINYGPFYYPCVLGKTNANNGYVVGGNLKRNAANVSGNASYFYSNPNDISMIYSDLAIITNAYTLDGNTLILSNEAISYLTNGYIATPIDNPMSFNVPNAVIDNSNDDGKIVAHPIYYPDAVKTDGLINIDLDALRDTIIDAIDNGRYSIDINDVVDAGAAVKADGTTLTDADTKTLDASIPIEAAKSDTISVPIGQIPGLPKLPPIIPSSGSSSVPDGFAGMSVLARIINVTVQSVPQPLIMCFFGVIFGMIILGIIKILHH